METIYSCEQNELDSIIDKLNKKDYDYRKILNVDNDIRFGLELEFNVFNTEDIIKKLKALNKIFIDRKSSTLINDKRIFLFKCDDSICEYKSPVLTNSEEDMMKLYKICELINKMNAFPSNRKGMHIHVDLSCLEEDTYNLHLLLKIYMLYEHIIRRFSYGLYNEPNIDINSYSRSISYLLYLYLTKNNLSEDFNENIKELRNILCNKNYSINFQKKCHNIKEHTIEFRHFNSTTDSFVVQNNINFILSLLSSIKNDETDRDLIDFKFSEYDKNLYEEKNYSNIYLEDAIELCDLAFNNEIDKNYFLRQYLIKDQKIKKLVI